MTGSTEALTQTLSEIRRRGASLDSDGLLSLVDANFAGISIEHEQQTIDTLLRAWDRVRDVPDVSVNEIVASTALKRDALKWLDVVYHASMYIDPANAGPLEAQFESGGLRQWWGRWTRGPHRMRRLAATSLLSLLDEGPPESIVALGCDRGGLWSSRADGLLVHDGEACRPSGVLGLEGPWAGVGMLATDAARGLAVVPSHDLAAWIESLDPGAAVVERDGPLLRLRVGWTSPCFVWMDPDRDMRVQRVIRRWMEGDVEFELETTPSAWLETASGVSVPMRVVLEQRVRGWPRPMLELDLKALQVTVGEGVDVRFLEPP